MLPWLQDRVGRMKTASWVYIAMIVLDLPRCLSTPSGLRHKVRSIFMASHELLATPDLYYVGSYLRLASVLIKPTGSPS